MKRQIKIFLTCTVAAILLVVIVLTTKNVNKTPHPQEGRYNIVETELYPDSYVIVTKDHIQFFNIDLNKFYKDKQIDTFLKLLDKGVISGYTEAELRDFADVNKLLVDTAFPLKKATISQEDAKLYRYHCSTFINGNGMTFFYDMQKNRIYFCTNDGDFYFQKEK